MTDSFQYLKIQFVYPFFCIAGVDEAGRGCLAGPVVAGAFIFPFSAPPPTVPLMDSKVLSAEKREKCFEWILQYAMWGVGESSALEIDQFGIKKATFLSMQRAIENLPQPPEKLHIDGNDGFSFSIPSESFIKGDARFVEISGASIVAKVIRDKKMKEYDILFPQYGFARHKGYGTKEHFELLKKYGASPVHRHGYEPLKTWETQGTLF